MLCACDIPVRSPRVGLPAQYGPRNRLARRLLSMQALGYRLSACSGYWHSDTGPRPPFKFPATQTPSTHQHTFLHAPTHVQHLCPLSLSSSHRRFSPYSPIIAPAPFSVSGLSLFVRCAKTVVCLGGWVGGQGGQASAPGTHV
jgi:hypothetical protein